MKYLPAVTASNLEMSHPSRGAWIEINIQRSKQERAKVAPHAGWVD